MAAIIAARSASSRSCAAAAGRCQLDQVIRETNATGGAGYREVVLRGINLGRWGREAGSRAQFCRLLRVMLAEHRHREAAHQLGRADGLERRADRNWWPRRRASPSTRTSAAIGIATACCAACIASTARWHYADRIGSASPRMPDAAIGADVMVGFPGETEQEFEETPRAHREPAIHLPARLHVFVAAGNAVGGDAKPGSGAGRPRSAIACCANWRRTRSVCSCSRLSDATLVPSL